MLSSDEILQISSQFDAQLVTLGNWSLGKRRELDEWLDQVTVESKSKVAAKIITSFILDCLKNDISIEGKVRIRKLKNIASLLEKIVFTTRELDEKFYRDHINHVLKVALLARAIAQKKPFSLNEDDLNKLLLACVFHDIAYPLSECGKIFSKTLESLKECFSTAELFRNRLVKEAKVDINLLSTLINEEEDSIVKMLRRLNHGLLSSIEFSKTLKEQSLNSYSDVIRAIAVHDSDFETEINALSEPLVGLLILADELQDWGRPTPYQNTTIIPRIEDFILENGKLSGTFTATNYKGFSVLKQITSKMKNLQRLHLSPNHFEFRIKYNLKGFEELEHNNYNHMLEMLFNVVDTKIVNPSENDALSKSPFFEKEFFGIEIEAPIKRNLFENLKSKELSKHSIMNKVNTYLNEDLTEMIFSEKVLGPINSIELNNCSINGVSACITGDGKDINGVFYSNSHNETMKLMQYLAAETRFINLMINEIGGAKLEIIDEFPKLESFAETTVLQRTNELLQGNSFLEVYKKLKLKTIVKCLRNKSCFLFISQ